MIQFGVAGAAAEWERYARAMSCLRRPVRVTAVYDPILARAEHVARTNGAAVCSGLRALAQRGDVEAILLTDCGWRGVPGFEILAQSGKPILLACALGLTREQCDREFEASGAAGVPRMPAMRWRFNPASLRVQELFATELGYPTHITIDLNAVPASANVRWSVVGWMDFARNFFKTYPTRGFLIRSDTGSASEILEVQCPARPGSGDSTPCRLHILLAESAAAKLASHAAERGCPSNGSPCCQEDHDRLPPIRIECVRGTIQIHGRDSIEWQLPSQAPRHEQLACDRTEEEIMLDLFCRKVVGGLIPIADFGDISAALKILDSLTLV